MIFTAKKPRILSPNHSSNRIRIGSKINLQQYEPIYEPSTSDSSRTIKKPRRKTTERPLYENQGLPTDHQASPRHLATPQLPTCKVSLHNPRHSLLLRYFNSNPASYLPSTRRIEKGKRHAHIRMGVHCNPDRRTLEGKESFLEIYRIACDLRRTRRCLLRRDRLVPH